MKIAVSGSSGLIGTALVTRLHAAGHDVVRLVRRSPRSTGEVQWDPAAGTVDLEALAGVEAAVNLSGAGVGDHRWTDEYKRTILQSRVDSTRTIATALAQLDPLPSVLVSASAVGIYGDRGDEELTETSARGSGFLSDVVAAWEAAAEPAAAAGIRVVHPRTGLVMSHSGGAFGRLMPLLKLGLAGPLGSGRQWWPWITLDDEVSALEFLIEKDLEGPVNVGSPDPRRNAELTRLLGSALHRPALLPVPKFALSIVVGEFASDITSSQRMVPTKLLDAGFTFASATAEQGADWLVHPR